MLCVAQQGAVAPFLHFILRASIQMASVGDDNQPPSAGLDRIRLDPGDQGIAVGASPERMGHPALAMQIAGTREETLPHEIPPFDVAGLAISKAPATTRLEVHLGLVLHCQAQNVLSPGRSAERQESCQSASVY
ncbi:hypothetical protein EJV46_01035 [Roseococcus sp. SYP-B2431]|nr:hypothetical protein EJV46_01035 [Roseococcus sp. SYP-B2431]